MFDLSQDEITEGSIPRVLVLLAAPLVAQNLVHVANALVDTFWLGRLGEDAVAAVGLNFPVIALVGAAMLPATIGTQILVSQRIGADELPDARRITFNGAVLAALIAVLMALTVGRNGDALMLLLGAGPELAQLAGLYLMTLLAFYPFAFASESIENSYTAWGDSRAALHVNVLTVAVNVVLDPFLIFGWGPFPALGVQGAALASGIGISVGFLLAVAYAAGLRDTYGLTRASLTPDLGVVRELVDVGYPIGAQRAVAQLVRVLVIALVTITGGAAAVAAYTVGTRVAGLAVVPGQGLQQAAQSIIGQNLGADKPDRAFRTTTVGVVIGAGALGLLGVFQWVFPGLIVDALVPGITEEGKALSVLYLRILALSYWALGATYVFLAAFNGASRTRTSLVVDLLKYWGIRLPIAVFALPATATVGVLGVSVAPGLGWGVEAIFWSVTVSNVVAVVGVGAYFLYTCRDGMLSRAARNAQEAAAD